MPRNCQYVGACVYICVCVCVCVNVLIHLGQRSSLAQRALSDTGCLFVWLTRWRGEVGVDGMWRGVEFTRQYTMRLSSPLAAHFAQSSLQIPRQPQMLLEFRMLSKTVQVELQQFYRN